MFCVYVFANLTLVQGGNDYGHKPAREEAGLASFHPRVASDFERTVPKRVEVTPGPPAVRELAAGAQFFTRNDMANDYPGIDPHGLRDAVNYNTPTPADNARTRAAFPPLRAGDPRLTNEAIKLPVGRRLSTPKRFGV